MTADSDSVVTVAAGRLSHEILNALAGIAGALEVLRERIGESDEDSVEVFSRIHSELGRMTRSVSELNAFATRSAPKLRATNLHHVIDRALARQPARASTRVSRDYGELPHVPVDETLLADALDRLFQNAYDAMPAGGVLTVTTQASAARVRVSVRDTGETVPAERLKQAFEPFYSSKTRGLGLGLAIARRHVEAHGGSIVAAPLASGGTEFTITLPSPSPSPAPLHGSP